MKPNSMPMGDIPALPPGFQAEAREQSAQIVNYQLDVGGKTLSTITLCAAFCGLCFAFCLFCGILAWDAKTEARMVEYYLMDPHYRTPEELQAWARFKEERK